jgi:general secretion pathway protein L
MSTRKLPVRNRPLVPTSLRRRAGDFLAWWWHGLLLALPERWRARLRLVPDIVTVEAQDDLLVFKLYAGAERRLQEERAITAQDESEQAGINHWLENHEKEVDLVLLVPPDRQLDTRLIYPMTSEKDLRAVLSHDMDIQTPFTDNQVYFDYTVTRKDRNNGKIHVHLYLVLRKTLRDLLDALSFLVRKPSAATTGMDGRTAGINFMPELERHVKDKFDKRFKLTALLSFILLIVVLYTPLMRYGTLTEQLENEVGKNRTQAMQAQTLIDRKQAILERANFLANQDRYQTPFIRLFHELTRCLPDDTWITQFVINKGEIQIRGESLEAASVIRLIEQSDYFEKARFRSPVIKSAGGEKEQFHIAALVVMR